MSDTSSSRGLGISGVLTIVFVVLKLTGVIDWSWWWVLAPMGIVFAFRLATFLVVGAVALILMKDVSRKRERRH